jgi:hypothetical protein
VKNAFLCAFVPMLLPETSLVGAQLLQVLYARKAQAHTLNGWAARRQPAESAGDAAAGDEQNSVSVQDMEKSSGFISRQTASRHNNTCCICNG